MKLTDAEWQIMNALWEKHPAPAREISERLPQKVDWAYTTIKTLLSRLVEKGAVKESKKGNISIYEPILSRDHARRRALKTLVDQAFYGAFGPLVHFLLEDKQLSHRQRQQLLVMLQEENTQKKGGKQ